MMKKSTAARETFFAVTIMLATILSTLFLVKAAPANAQERQPDRAGQFDFYVLSLSWSPTFCDTQRGGRNAQQCGGNKDFGFIVHGLWPQYEQGYPEFCKVGEPGRVPTLQNSG